MRGILNLIMCAGVIAASSSGGHPSDYSMQMGPKSGGARGPAVMPTQSVKLIKRKPAPSGHSAGSRGMPSKAMAAYYVKSSAPRKAPLATTRSTGLRAGKVEQPSFLSKFKSAVGLGKNASPPRPTPRQPSYLNARGPMYEKQKSESVLTSVYHQVFGSNEKKGVQRAHMDGVSKPNWSLDKF